MKMELYYSQLTHFALYTTDEGVIAARYSDKTGHYVIVTVYNNSIEEVIEKWSSLGIDDWQLIYSEKENS